jgi:hypothetical protein
METSGDADFRASTINGARVWPGAWNGKRKNTMMAIKVLIPPSASAEFAVCRDLPWYPRDLYSTIKTALTASNSEWAKWRTG